MVFYCPHCGNEIKFYADRNFRETGTERVFMYGDGNEYDYGDRNTIDAEYITERLFCGKCNKTAMMFDDDIELEIYRCNHKPIIITTKHKTNWKEKLQNLGALKEVK